MARRFTVAEVRERLAEALDAADQGIPVVIERRGVRYRLTAEPAIRPRAARRRPRIVVLDAAVRGGEWGWDWSPDGLAFDAT